MVVGGDGGRVLVDIIINVIIVYRGIDRGTWGWVVIVTFIYVVADETISVTIIVCLNCTG